MPIRKLSDTALWVAMYRAFESERSDALFHDPYARRMAGSRGDQIVRKLPFGQAMGWSIVVRTVLMDEIILRCVAQGARCVINLGAGLDTRAFRLPLPADLAWFDLDLPEIVAHRRDCLKDETPTCKHTDVALDLSDVPARDRVLKRVNAGCDSVLLITEGLLIYLSPDEVAGLAQQLQAQQLARWWLTDLIAPWLAMSAGAMWQPQLAAARAPFKFAPVNGTEFFRPLGWQEAELRSVWDESLRLKRPAPMAWWGELFGMSFFAGGPAGLRRSAGVALLERMGSSENASRMRPSAL